MPHYFAFGSNMSPRQMQRRCPGARAVGVARLDGWRFIITTHGGANIVPSPGDRVLGVLWRVTGRHLADLDGWEGVSAGVYRRTTCYVRVLTRVRAWSGAGAGAQLADDRVTPAVVYISARRWPGIGSPQYIKTAILRGAEAFGMTQAERAEFAGWLARRPIGPTRQVYRGRRTPRPSIAKRR